MRVSELQQKELVEISNGKKIGNIIDLIIEPNGYIKSLIVEENSFNRRFIKSSREEIVVEWNKIVKIGEDMILINNNHKNI